MPREPNSAALVWFRRDLRIRDHAALAHALAACGRLYCTFVFDREILDALASKADRRVEFIAGSLRELDARLRESGGGLIVVHDRSQHAIPALAARLGVQSVFAARDYEPAAVRRDLKVDEALRADGRTLTLVKDQVIFERDDGGVTVGAVDPMQSIGDGAGPALQALAEGVREKLARAVAAID